MSAEILPDVAISRPQAIEAGRTDLDFFAAMAAPEVFRFCYPPIFKAIWQLLTMGALKPAGKDRLAIGIPRGFGKTMLLKLFVAWMVAYTDRKFILIVCNTASLAENFIADVADILSSPNFVRIFGDWRYTLEKDTQGLKKFHFRGRSVILAGLGAGSSLRGLNIKLERPDCILQDDMQSREEAASPIESVKTLSWMIGTLMKANDNSRCLHCFVGNMYPYEGSILRKLQTNTAWISFVTGAILEDGQSLWPEMRSVEDILEELENDESLGHPEIFFAEVMNDPVAGSRSGLDHSKINMFQGTDEDLTNSPAGFVIIDPSLGRKRSDDIAIGAFQVYEAEPVMAEVLADKFNPLQTIENALKLAARHNISAIVVEAVAYQATLCFWFNHVMAQKGLKGFKILEISPEGVQKISRILDMFKQLTAEKERIWLHKRVRAQVTHQATYFDPLKNNNKDDILDLLAYAYRVIAKHKSQIIKPFEMQVDEYTEAAFSEHLQLEF